MRNIVLPFISLALFLGCGSPNPSYQGRTTRQWIESLDTRDPARQQQAIQALVQCGVEAVPQLTEALTVSDREVCSSAALVLLQLGEPGRKAVLQALAHGEPLPRVDVARACLMANVESPVAMAVVLKGLQDSDSDIRHEAVHALGDLSPKSTSAVPPLTAALRSPSGDVRWRAAHALNRIGPGAKDAVPALALALSDADARVRHAAATALGSIGPQARSATQALVAALADRDEEVRWRAGEVLKSWGVEALPASFAAPLCD